MPTSTVDPTTGRIPGEPYLHAAAPKARIDSVDLLRGIVMVIMLLDHTRDFTHWAALQFDPADLTRTSAALFFTRWITHFCAPVFVFLAGTGAYLQLSRGKTRAQLSRFLWTRGLWLILLEFTVIRFAIFFNVDYSFLGVMQVIWVLGWSMIALAGLIYLPLKVVAGFGIGMMLLHNLLDPVQVAQWQGPASRVPDAASKLWMILHQQGAFPVAGFPSPIVYVLYPLIPWIGVMAAGYAFGTLYDIDPARRRAILLRLGLGLTAAFLILRALNLYGDPAGWSVQKSSLFTALSFLNVTKYPPSLLFLLMTLGPALLALWWFERPVRNAIGRAVITFGRVPMFFYILQWYTAHLIGIGLHVAAGKPVPGPPGLSPPPVNSGFGLGVTYMAWIAGTLLLYPLCRWFAGVKARRRDWWLSYL
ncbi:MAG TPA: heparan-alpha-glucosaminide N-acetyltransferase domain-containing protein [Gemmatimonadaceae bacterium]|nr:heparan-alpha-glucosaminide N-acetyltransferase domain-containing protein [Gemmatimonadaceae bacterium]